MSDNEIILTLPTLHAPQSVVSSSSARFKVLCCGRRFGKTTLAIDEIIGYMLDGKQCAYFAPTYKMLNHVWRKIKRLTNVRSVGGHNLVRDKNETLHRLELITGGALDCWSLQHGDSVRGQAYDFVVIDEARFIPYLMDLWLEDLSPLLTETIGGALICSTPNGYNDFHTFFSYGIDGVEGWESFHFPTSTNPRISAVELARIENSVPMRVWQQEYLAQFVSETGGVFRGVADVTTQARIESAYTSDFVIGVDWGKSKDYTVISVIDRNTGIEVDFDRFNQISWELQRGRLVSMVEKWKPSIILAEKNSIGEPNIEALEKEGLPVQGFNTTSASKTPLIDGLALAIERREIALIADKIATAELMAYAFEQMRGGGWRYSAPAGMHDDSVIARALAWRACTMTIPTIDINPINPLTRRR